MVETPDPPDHAVGSVDQLFQGRLGAPFITVADISAVPATTMLTASSSAFFISLLHSAMRQNGIIPLRTKAHLRPVADSAMQQNRACREGGLRR